MTDITESHPRETVYCIASGNRTFRYHCADALKEGISPVSNENQYRQHARECFELANEMNDPGNKALLVAMAQSWSNLADQAAKNAGNRRDPRNGHSTAKIGQSRKQNLSG